MNLINQNPFSPEVDKTVSILARTFKFGYFSFDDMLQQGRLFALEALPRWDGIRQLENFIYSHVRNRFINFRRDYFCRNDPPPTGQIEQFNLWVKRNQQKQALAQPAFQHPLPPVGAESVYHATDLKDTLEKVDQNLPPDLRVTYLQMRSGLTVPGHLRQKVETTIKTILSDLL